MWTFPDEVVFHVYRTWGWMFTSLLPQTLGQTFSWDLPKDYVVPDRLTKQEVHALNAEVSAHRSSQIVLPSTLGNKWKITGGWFPAGGLVFVNWRGREGNVLWGTWNRALQRSFASVGMGWMASTKTNLSANSLIAYVHLTTLISYLFRT